jgi:hypothetical protein
LVICFYITFLQKLTIRKYKKYDVPESLFLVIHPADDGNRREWGRDLMRAKQSQGIHSGRRGVGEGSKPFFPHGLGATLPGNGIPEHLCDGDQMKIKRNFDYNPADAQRAQQATSECVEESDPAGILTDRPGEGCVSCPLHKEGNSEQS